MRLLHVALVATLCSPAMAQTVPIANSINTTNAGQATGSVINQNTQLNQLPIMQQEYGPGFRCQNSTISINPYYVGSNTGWQGGMASGLGGMVSIAIPLDNRGVALCMAMARARVAKEEFDLEIVRALRCGDLLRAGIQFAPGNKLCDGIVYNPQLDATRGQALPQPSKPSEVILTR